MRRKAVLWAATVAGFNSGLGWTLFALHRFSLDSLTALVGLAILSAGGLLFLACWVGAVRGDNWEFDSQQQQQQDLKEQCTELEDTLESIADLLESSLQHNIVLMNMLYAHGTEDLQPELKAHLEHIKTVLLRYNADRAADE